MKIQIYGSGCVQCKRLYDHVETALRAAGMDAELEKVTDLDAIVAAGVLQTPALAVDGKILRQGKVCSPGEIAALLKLEPVPMPCACGTGRQIPAKRLAGILLLCFAVASLGWAIYRETAARTALAAVQPAVPVPAADKTLTVYYFHGNQRCPTCRRIEELTRKTLETDFPAKLKSGDIVFESVNLDEPRNEHFIADFALDSKIVVMRKGSKFTAFPEVWTLVRNPEAFSTYIRDGVEKMQ